MGISFNQQCPPFEFTDIILMVLNISSLKSVLIPCHLVRLETLEWIIHENKKNAYQKFPSANQILFQPSFHQKILI